MEKYLILIVFAFVSALFVLSCRNSVKNSNIGVSLKETKHIAENLSVEQSDSLIKAESGNDKFFIVDVRTPSEYSGGHIKNAFNVDYNSPMFGDSIKTFEKDNIYLIYCQSGNRSGKALLFMAGEGFKEVYNMTGGIGSWKSKGYPVER